VKDKHFLNIHKGATFIWILLLMAYFNRWDNPTLWVYFALHGTYGLLWVFKSLVFPDKQWEAPASLVRGIFIWVGLSLYWITPYLIASQNIQAPYWLLALAISFNIVGSVFHFASDMQKYIELQLKPGHLITGGFWKLSRSPNYFGELLIYMSFVMLAMHWFPWAVLGFVMLIGWIPYIRKKEHSLSRYPEFVDYKARTRLLIPFIF
jgi:steroid 5-alpha reductase family enzyme